MKKGFKIVVVMLLFSVLGMAVLVSETAYAISEKQTIRVGFYEDGDYMSRNKNGAYIGFTRYCEENGINLNVTPYAETGQLLEDLKNGQLDGVAITHLGRNSTFRSVAQFPPSPLYISVAPGKADLLSQLNAAMNTLALRNPNFNSQLYNKYFAVSVQQQPVFTKEEKEFIQESEEITAIYVASNAPLEYMDPERGTFSGVVADLFQYISDCSGLQFKFYPSADIAESLKLIKSPDINVMCGTTSGYLWNSVNKVKTT